jgi:hypothetical protein
MTALSLILLRPGNDLVQSFEDFLGLLDRGLTLLYLLFQEERPLPAAFSFDRDFVMRLALRSLSRQADLIGRMETRTRTRETITPSLELIALVHRLLARRP